MNEKKKTVNEIPQFSQASFLETHFEHFQEEINTFLYAVLLCWYKIYL